MWLLLFFFCYNFLKCLSSVCNIPSSFAVILIKSRIISRMGGRGFWTEGIRKLQEVPTKLFKESNLRQDMKYNKFTLCFSYKARVLFLKRKPRLINANFYLFLKHSGFYWRKRAGSDYFIFKSTYWYLSFLFFLSSLFVSTLETEVVCLVQHLPGIMFAGRGAIGSKGIKKPIIGKAESRLNSSVIISILIDGIDWKRMVTPIRDMRERPSIRKLPTCGI